MNILKSKHFKTILISITALALITAGILYWTRKDATPAEAGWWNDSWSYRKAIVINHGYVTGDLENFPVLISLTDASLGTHAQADGDDIIFISQNGQKLSHEIEAFDNTTGKLAAWVKVPSLSSADDTQIFMYYGNAGVGNQEDAANVWNESYNGVYHLAGGSGADSTGYHRDGTASIGASSTAYIGGSGVFATFDPGDLDTTWGGGGYADYDSGGNDAAYDAVQAADGSVFVAGYYVGSGGIDWMIRKYAPGGAIDTAWGDNGMIIYSSSGSHNDYAQAIALDSGGSIYVGGYYYNIANSDPDWMVRKYDADGKLCNGSGTSCTWGPGDAGYVTYENDTTTPLPDEITRLYADADGKLYVGGFYYHQSYSDNDWLIIKYTATGTPDWTWGGGDGMIDYQNNYGDNKVQGMAVSTSTGELYAAGPDNDEWGDPFWTMRKYTAAGVPDTTWGTNGIVTYYAAAYSQAVATALALSATGEIYVTGTYDTSNGWMMRKYDADGKLCNGSGTSCSWAGGNGYVTFADNSSNSMDLALNSSDELYAAGSVRNASDDWMIRKYDSSGVLDASWGSGGIVEEDLTAGTDKIQSIYLAADGTVFAAGVYNTSDWMVRKYSPGGGGSVAIGPAGSIKSASFWIKAGSTSEQIIDINGNAYIQVAGGTLSAPGWSSPTIYVDGTAGTALDTGWHLVTVTSATALDATSTDLGVTPGGYYNGLLDETRFSSTELSAAWIATEYNTENAPETSLSVQAEETGPGPVGYWSFDDPSAGSEQEGGVHDESGQGNHGTNYGAVQAGREHVRLQEVPQTRRYE